MKYKKMAEDIDKLVNRDFVSDMEVSSYIGDGTISQEDAVKMAKILSEIYFISHCLHCEACGNRYK